MQSQFGHFPNKFDYGENFRYVGDFQSEDTFP